MAAKSGRKASFAKKSPVDSAYILWDKKFCQNRSITHRFPHKCFQRFMQKFKMATKSGRKVIFVKSHQYTLDSLGVENFDKIALSRTVKEIEANLCVFPFLGKIQNGRHFFFLRFAE